MASASRKKAAWPLFCRMPQLLNLPECLPSWCYSVYVIIICCCVTNYPQTQPFQWQTCIASRVPASDSESHIDYNWVIIRYCSHFRVRLGRTPQVHTLECWWDSVPPATGARSLRSWVKLAERCLSSSLCSLPYMTTHTVAPVSMRVRKWESKEQRTSKKQARFLDFIFMHFFSFGCAGSSSHVQACSSCGGDYSSCRSQVSLSEHRP